MVSPLPTALEAIRDLVRDRPPAVLPARGAMPCGRSSARARSRRWRRSSTRASPSRRRGSRTRWPSRPPGRRWRRRSTGSRPPTRTGSRAGSPTPRGAGGRPAVAAGAGAAGGVAARLRARAAPRVDRGRAAVARRGRGARPRDERIEATLARCAGSRLAATTGMPGRQVRGHWLLASHNGRTGRLRPAAQVELVPLVGAPAASGWSDDNDDVLLSVRYALPRGATASPGSLEALLGHRRAALLRRARPPARGGSARRPAVPRAERAHAPPRRARGGRPRHPLIARAGGSRSRARARADALLALYDA